MESLVSKKRRGRTPGPVPESGVAPVQSLARGLAILERLAGAEGGVALTDLAQRVGLSPSTTHRLLGTMEKMDFVNQAGDLGLWSIGVKAFIVGSAFVENGNLIATAHPFLRRLMEQSGETTNLAILDTSEAVFLDQVQCHEMMRMLARLGSRMRSGCAVWRRPSTTSTRNPLLPYRSPAPSRVSAMTASRSWVPSLRVRRETSPMRWVDAY
jgi:AraC-like DNA-binding protein